MKKYSEKLWGKKGQSAFHKIYYSSGFQRLEEAASESPGKLLKKRFLGSPQEVKVSVNSFREENGHTHFDVSFLGHLFVSFLCYADVWEPQFRPTLTEDVSIWFFTQVWLAGIELFIEKGVVSEALQWVPHGYDGHHHQPAS